MKVSDSLRYVAKPRQRKASQLQSADECDQTLRNIQSFLHERNASKPATPEQETAKYSSVQPAKQDMLELQRA